MEERKLNYNAPLLSVRRFSTTTASSNGVKGKRIGSPQLNRRHTLPCYKPDVSLDQVTEPVAVPFRWEQIPGRPKDGSMPEPEVTEEGSSVAPRIPPGRVLDIVKYSEDKKIEDRSGFRPQIEAKSFNYYGNELDCSQESVNEKAGLVSENDDDNDDDVYSDALDTLSPTDSFSMNCSASGLSSSDGPIVKPSGSFSMDPQTRDFMMSRFLPAAKAMALEPPHYASRKQPAAAEQSRQIVKVVSRDRTPPPARHEAVEIPHYSKDKEEKESEDEDDEYDDSGNLPVKACGWLPRLCFKNSLCLLNPVPAMKLRAQASVSSTRDVGKLSKAGYNRSHGQTKGKSKDAVHIKKSDGGMASPRLLGVENKLTNGSNRFTNASDRPSMSRTSPFRRTAGVSPFRRSGGISPCRNETSQSHRGSGFLGVPKEAENFKSNRLNLYIKGASKSQELFLHHGPKRWSRPVSPTVEKTLYVDTVNRSTGRSYSKSGSLDIKECVDLAGKDFKASLKSREMEETGAAKNSFQEAKCPNVSKEVEEPERRVLGSGDSDLSFPPIMSPLRGQADMIEDSCQESKALVCIAKTVVENLNIDSDQISKEDDQGIVKTSFAESPLHLVLPKTPSESWLWRTLPSIPSQNPISHLYRGNSFLSKWQDSKISSTSTKWETIVKSSNLHHDHVRYSEELIPHASQQSKS